MQLTPSLTNGMYCVNSASHFIVIYRVTNSKAEVHFPEEVMTVTTHPPCTIEIPSVESEWAVIRGVGRGIHHHWWVCIEQM